MSHPVAQPQRPSEPEPVAGDSASERERVYTWRLACILRTEAILMEPARKLARSKSDLHKIVTALEQGCPAGVAVAIFT